MKKLFLSPGVGVAFVLSVASLTACDNGPSAVEERVGSDSRSSTYASRDYAGEDSRAGSRDQPRAPDAEVATPTVDGKPMWSASQRYTAEENARRAYDRNGEAFGARDMDDFVRKAHAFVEKPPRGTETLKRANGDTLFYDPEGNIFAVANREGAPRTMFKPDDGPAYWEEQKTREAERSQRALRRSSSEES
jgi:pyocin large subunit-like protein